MSINYDLDFAQFRYEVMAVLKLAKLRKSVYHNAAGGYDFTERFWAAHTVSGINTK
jgi:hypothetical protein